MKAFEKNTLCQMLGIEFPLILAPMFLVSNEKMILEAIKSGATGAFPAHNYRTSEDLRVAIRSLKSKTSGAFGVNLIVNKSNTYHRKQLQVCCEEKVAFLITSLGSPEESITMAHENGIKVFCDVVDAEFAQKVERLGADAVIAVNNRAGGHAGNLSPVEIMTAIKQTCNIPVIAAGGVGDGKTMKEMMQLGAVGVSVGTVFIATNECDVSDDYKQACIKYGAQDIKMSTRLSGTPCTVINTPYVQKTGTGQGWLTKLLQRNKRLKKWIKALTFLKGMSALKEAAFTNTYKTIWCAGPSIDYVKEIRNVSDVIGDMRKEFDQI